LPAKKSLVLLFTSGQQRGQKRKKAHLTRKKRSRPGLPKKRDQRNRRAGWGLNGIECRGKSKSQKTVWPANTMAAKVQPTETRCGGVPNFVVRKRETVRARLYDKASRTQKRATWLGTRKVFTCSRTRLGTRGGPPTGRRLSNSCRKGGVG